MFHRRSWGSIFQPRDILSGRVVRREPCMTESFRGSCLEGGRPVWASCAERYCGVPGALPLRERNPVAYFARPGRGFPPDVLRATAARTSVLNARESILSPS